MNVYLYRIKYGYIFKSFILPGGIVMSLPCPSVRIRQPDVPYIYLALSSYKQPKKLFIL
jgi:hypothetical protein